MLKIDFYHIFWFLSYFRNMIKKKPMVPAQAPPCSDFTPAKWSSKYGGSIVDPVDDPPDPDTLACCHQQRENK